MPAMLSPRRVPLPAEWPDYLHGYRQRPDANHYAQKEPPEGFVFHCGDKGADLADAALRMDISYHFAWDIVPDEPDVPGEFVQLVSLKRRAFHGGIEGNDWIGVALSGPPEQNPRPEQEGRLFQRLIRDTREAFGGHPMLYCLHSEITPGKRDPGPGLAKWLDGLGLIHEPKGPSYRWRRGR